MSAILFSALIFSLLSGSVVKLLATLGRVLDPFGRPLRLGGSAGPRSPPGIQLRGAVRMPQFDGPTALDASPEVDDDGDAGGGAMVSAAISLRNCLGSSSIFGGFTSKSLSSTNSTDSTLELPVISRFTSFSGARGRLASTSRDRHGGRRVDVEMGGAEQ